MFGACEWRVEFEDGSILFLEAVTEEQAKDMASDFIIEEKGEDMAIKSVDVYMEQLLKKK